MSEEGLLVCDGRGGYIVRYVGLRVDLVKAVDVLRKVTAIVNCDEFNIRYSA